jgi:hypothetical protein
MDVVDSLIHHIKNEISCSFSKYGDGEYYCATGHQGHNCDNDNYTPSKRSALTESFKYMVEQAPNAYIGLWHTNDIQKSYWEQQVSKPILWANYHTMIIDYDDIKNQSFHKKIQLYKTIKESPMKKIMVCNKLLIKAKLLLNIDELVHIQFQNWFDQDFESTLQNVKLAIGDCKNPMILTSGGMAAKILIRKLAEEYPKGIFLDIGSALDIICTKHNSRGWNYDYATIYSMFSSIIPDDWEQPRFEIIYNRAQHLLGVHLNRQPTVPLLEAQDELFSDFYK